MQFTKMQGLGNDYIYVNLWEEEITQPEKLAVRWSDRHFGIGADGLILIGKSEIADVRMEMYNADGSSGAMCGNGIRCVAKYAYEQGLVRKKKIKIETLSGVKETILLPNGEVCVNMGTPIVEVMHQKVTFRTDKEYEGTVDYISMGNPHAVVYPEEFGWDEDPEHLELESWGPLFERHLGEKRVNTEFLRVLDRKTMELRVWERGSAETLACGTGACAAAVSSILRNLTDREVRIKLKGGNLLVKWGEDGESLYMTGPAVTVFKGDITV